MKLHISDDNVFLDYAIEQFEAVSSGKNIYLVNTKKPKHIKNTDKIIAIEPESSEYKQYINQLENFDAVILHALTNDYFETQEIEEKANEQTVLFGNNSVLDSMGLVNVIIDIESSFLDEDIEISLTSEKAMSRRNSPFRTVTILAEYIIEQIEENNE